MGCLTTKALYLLLEVHTHRSTIIIYNNLFPNRFIIGVNLNVINDIFKFYICIIWFTDHRLIITEKMHSLDIIKNVLLF